MVVLIPIVFMFPGMGVCLVPCLADMEVERLLQEQSSEPLSASVTPQNWQTPCVWCQGKPKGTLPDLGACKATEGFDKQVSANRRFILRIIFRMRGCWAETHMNRTWSVHQGSDDLLVGQTSACPIDWGFEQGVQVRIQTANPYHQSRGT